MRNRMSPGCINIVKLNRILGESGEVTITACDTYHYDRDPVTCGDRCLENRMTWSVDTGIGHQYSHLPADL